MSPSSREALRRPLISPNGRVDVEGVDFLRIRDSPIAEWVYSEDALGLFRQLGAMPPDISRVAGPSNSPAASPQPGG
jgi:hypothetical protein